MEYYGDLNKKRLLQMKVWRAIDMEDNASSEIGYINSKGLLLDYVLKHYYKGYTYSFSQNCKIHPCDEDPYIIYSDCWSKLKMSKIKNKIYYTGKCIKHNEEYYCVFIELPRIANDGTFTWKENRKYGTLEATIKSDNFEYLCISKMDGNAFVEVKYTKQENKHRNNVTVARIEVYNASNEDILAAIKKWQNEIISDFTRKEITA